MLPIRFSTFLLLIWYVAFLLFAVYYNFTVSCVIGGTCYQRHVQIPYPEGTFSGHRDIRFILADVACQESCSKIFAQLHGVNATRTTEVQASMGSLPSPAGSYENFTGDKKFVARREANGTISRNVTKNATNWSADFNLYVPKDYVEAVNDKIPAYRDKFAVNETDLQEVRDGIVEVLHDSIPERWEIERFNTMVPSLRFRFGITIAKKWAGENLLLLRDEQGEQTALEEKEKVKRVLQNLIPKLPDEDWLAGREAEKKSTLPSMLQVDEAISAGAVKPLWEVSMRKLEEHKSAEVLANVLGMIQTAGTKVAALTSSFFEQNKAVFRKAHRSLQAAARTLTLNLYDHQSHTSCNRNCQQVIALQNSMERIPEQMFVLKYYGRWAFLPVFGLHEFFSVLFSLGNMIPHLLFFLWSIGLCGTKKRKKSEREITTPKTTSRALDNGRSSTTTSVTPNENSVANIKNSVLDKNTTLAPEGENSSPASSTDPSDIIPSFPGHSVFQFYQQLWHFFGVNLFLQSALFHAYESKVTLFLDVFSVQLTFVVSLFMARRLHLIGFQVEKRTGKQGSDPEREQGAVEDPSTVKRECLCFLLPALFLTLSFNLYNAIVLDNAISPVAVGMLIGGVGTTLFFALPLFHNCYKNILLDEAAFLVVMIGPFPMAFAFEVLDFPPSEFFYLLDAHAMWHLATIPMQIWWWRVFVHLEKCLVTHASEETSKDAVGIRKKNE
ncbi:unnamed protein product [Amoebophrya sp. A120]|nr:unnamed protein product [Amoebophrya sp. A120]|eukprot:GSA120T00008322001.1